jgi:hypothetical protein
MVQGAASPCGLLLCSSVFFALTAWASGSRYKTEVAMVSDLYDPAFNRSDVVERLFFTVCSCSVARYCLQTILKCSFRGSKGQDHSP